MGSPLFQECFLGNFSVFAMYDENGKWEITFACYDPETGKNVTITRVMVETLPETREELLELFISELRKQIA